MDPVQILQTTLNGFLHNQAPVGNESAPVASNITGAATVNPLPLAVTPATILSLFLSFSALRDWLKLIVIGGVVETSRRLCLKLWSTFIEAFWITASFEEHDDSYNWILFWLSKHPKWREARIIDVSTRSFGLNSPAISVGDDETKGRKMCYLPSFSRTYTLWYRGHYLSVTRTQIQDGIYSRNKEVLQLDIFARNHNVLSNLLLEAKRDYHAAEEHLISIWVSETRGSWRHVASRAKRPLKSIVLDPGVKDLILDDARDFLQSKEWYSARGIPFRRGYLLYGAPGSGKTSIIQSLAGELGLDVYIISLSRVGLDDTALSELISDLPEQCIALMEDIDAAFHHGLTREFDKADETGEKTDGAEADASEHAQEKADGAPPPPSASRVTLSGLLNALDGVGAQEGRLLFATTNRYHSLDPALCRPGRMDLHVEFKLASKYQARELFKCFYLPSADDDDAKDTRSSRSEADRASSSGSRSSSRSSSPESPSKLSDEDASDEKSVSSVSGSQHCSSAVQLTKAEVHELADRFAEAIPEREFSMATLQGYLMSYKIRPADAADAVADWVESERAERKKGKKGRNTTA
ncbi:hypothetical protein EIP86_009918 [Pleurotus ostreatoroseus]|nr:hypothetical protein EIP86_009918 [Pleurotus ostreatoroseus]